MFPPLLRRHFVPPTLKYFKVLVFRFKVVLFPLDNSFFDLLLLVINDLFQLFNKLKKLAMLLVNFIFEDEVGSFVCISGSKARNISDGFEHCFLNNCCFMLTKPFIKSITIELFPALFEHCQLLVEFVMAATINKPFTKDQTLLAPHHIINSSSYDVVEATLLELFLYVSSEVDETGKMRVSVANPPRALLG